MTYINLLPQEDRKKKLDYRFWVLFAAVVIGAAVLAAVYCTAKFQLDQWNAEYEGLEQQMAMIQPVLGKIKEQEGELDQWQQRLRSVRETDRSSDAAAGMVMISQLIPPQVSLVRLTQSEKEMTLEGESADYRGIAALMDALEGSGRFTGVELVSSYLNQDRGGRIGFRIIGKFKL